jgi:type II secretory pathway predicted ATPase ExeA
MDILQYFHLNEHPFRIGPDPRFLYLSDQVKEAIAKCEYMARERIGPIYIYAPSAPGKPACSGASTNAWDRTISTIDAPDQPQCQIQQCVLTDGYGGL